MIDSTDRKILKLLQEDARMSNAEIARRIGLVPSAVLNRIRRMEEDKVILSYEARLNPEALGLGMGCFIKIHSGETPGKTDIGRKIAEMPEVEEVHFMAADFYYLIKVRETSPSAHVEFIRKLGKIGVTDCYTLLVLDTLKETFRLKVPEK